MPSLVKIAVLQMTSGIDPADNARALTAAVADAAANGAQMLFAPEMAGLIDRDRARAAAHIVTEADSLFIRAARSAALRHGIWVHLGSVPVMDVGDTMNGATDVRWRNRSLVIDPHGDICGRYDKIHLFDIDLPTGESWRESSAYAPGDTAVICPSPVGPLGLTICYDLRFPRLFTALADAGAQVIAVPAAFTVPTGEAHWHLLLRARALDAGAFIIAAAQAGAHDDGRHTYGHSLVVDPWGTVILDMGAASQSGPSTGTGQPRWTIGYADIDADQIAAVRGRLPLTQHRRAFMAPAPLG
jgi:deaminated glutathione amidase